MDEARKPFSRSRGAVGNAARDVGRWRRQRLLFQLSDRGCHFVQPLLPQAPKREAVIIFGQEGRKDVDQDPIQRLHLLAAVVNFLQNFARTDDYLRCIARHHVAIRVQEYG